MYLGDVSRWVTQSVTNMSGMFSGCEEFSCDLSQWKVENVTDMSYMFAAACAFSADLSAWDTRWTILYNINI